MCDVVIRDAAREPCAVEAVVGDYALDAVSLERDELSRLAEDVGSGRRAGLVGFTGDGSPVGILLYNRSPDQTVAVDFVHVLRSLQTKDAERQFLRSSLTTLTAHRTPEVTVEAFVAGTLAQMERVLAELGFAHYPRHLMVCDLGEADFEGAPTAGAGAPLSPYLLLPWGAAAHDEVARLLFTAHTTRTEARMGGDSLEGALAETDSIARSKLFRPDISTLAMEGSTPIGVVMVTQPSAEDLMVVEVSVAPAYQGRGVGRAIMARTLRQAALTGSHAAWLVVNAANRPAVKLYRSVGFTVSRPVINCRWRASARPLD